MSISFSGLASGLDTSSWVEALVAAKKTEVTKFQTQLTGYQTTKTTLNDTRSAFSSLRTAIEKLTDAKFGGSMDLFAKNMAKSSNEDIFTATATNSAARQDYDVKVKQLATYTKALSKESASAVADDSTKLTNLGIKDGTFTAYVNGQKHVINIGKDDTLGDFKARLAEFGVKTEVDAQGVLKFSAQNEGDSINIGATDSSNLASLVGLAKQEDGTYASTNSLYKASVLSKLTDENSGFNEQIKAGTFTIGNATFTITDKTTLSSLISEINNNDEAQAYAYWDDATGKLSITSKKEGASYINIEAGTSNFTDVMGFTESEWDADGNVVSSKMFTDAQELGQNAIFSVNGTTMTSTSNVVTSDISRMDGITLTLKRTNTEEDGNTTLKVSQDTTGLKDALNEFIKAYNAAMTKTEEVTATGADLHGETSLTSLSRTLRNYANSSNAGNGGVYKLLSDIGISTAAADGKNLDTNTYELKLDEEKLMKALEENPESVKSILTGDGGVLSMMESAVEQSLKSVTGFFDIKTSTLDSNIKKMNERITKKNTSIETYKAQLEKKFSAMETMIAKMQQNYSSFL